MMSKAMLARGKLWHTRHVPVVNRFHYASYFVLLPMRQSGVTKVAKVTPLGWGPLSFHPCDHGTGTGDIVAWVDDILNDSGISDANGELWLQTYPRVLGYAFKPVSFWFACDLQGKVKAVLAEVNNTFGERHVYLIKSPPMDGRTATWADKVFHVSPFCSVQGQYAFRFHWAPDHPHLQIQVDLHQHGQLVLQTGLAGDLQVLTRANAWQAFWGVPLMTFGVVLRIHWQALRLALKRVPFFRKPPPPQQTVT